MLRAKRWLGALLPCLLLAHDGGQTLKKPSAAAPQILAARAKLDAYKKGLAAKGLFACCRKKTCDLCAQRYGKCECAKNLADHKAVCGQCLPQFKAKGATLEKPKAAVAMSPESQEIAKLLLEAKRTLVKEKRYACCQKGGCTECTLEADCPCGKDLASSTKEKPKGVCGSCYHAWHAGEGSFSGITADEVALAQMDPGMGMMFVSGTAQLPQQAPMYMTSTQRGAWTVMGMSQAFVVASQQSSGRGGDKVFSGNWLMPMASRRVGAGTLTLRGMVSLEPATVTGGSYPMLFQTGETYRGVPILNGQHPHSFFMELAALYQLPVRDNVTLHFYGGPRGEPALGPIPYPHRLSASENPMATLAHHYQDSTHIATNVVTSGITVGRFGVEASGFLGREPGERRWELERGGMDSWSTRFTAKPTGRLLMQFSLGRIASRESLHPEKDSERQSASMMYVRPHTGGYWASSLVWGRNVDIEGHHGGSGGQRQIFNSYLAESTALLRQKHWVWTRLEHTDKDSLLLDPNSEEYRLAKVSALTIGYGHELPSPRPWLSLSIGGQLTAYRTPEVLKPFYGASPVGAQVFLRLRLKSSRMTF
jgi:hypothetical protein